MQNVRKYLGIKSRAEWLSLGAISFILIASTILQYTAAPQQSGWHALYRYFYFLPITYAALQFGLVGGLWMSLFVTLVFAPHMLLSWGHFPEDSLNDLLVLIIFYCVALITGVTVDRLHQAQTEQQRMAENLAASLRQLEMQGEELRRAERLSSLGTLAGGLAHEIRNPVGIIRASAQLLAMECQPQAEEMTTIIKQESDRIELLIQNLLNFAGAEQLQRQETDIAELLARVHMRMQPLTNATGIDFCVDAPTQPLSARVDQNQLEQALVNLCMNAVQALDGTGRITLQAEQIGLTGNTLVVRVSDDGPGIPVEVQPHIFDPFFTTKDTGSGLGLSLVQRIVSEHEGRITVESMPGRGAAFVIQLPLV